VVNGGRREVVGLYVDMTQGLAVKDSRLFLVERTSGDKLVVTAEGGGPVSAILNHLTGEELAEILECIYKGRGRRVA
jgi:hypothetical protein